MPVESASPAARSPRTRRPAPSRPAVEPRPSPALVRRARRGADVALGDAVGVPATTARTPAGRLRA